MTSIGGLSQYLYGNSSTSSGGLAQYLNNSSTGNGTAFVPTTLPGGSGDSGGSTDTSLLGGSVPTYAFPTDASGRPVVATQADMDAVAQPADKLTIAGQVAEAIRMQSDCSVKGGRADRIADMTKQTQTLLDAVTKVVSGVATTDGSVAAGQADPAVTPYKSSISTALSRIASVMTNLQVLTSKASSDVAGQTKTSLAALDSEASTLAAQAGLDWSAISKTAKSSISASASATTATTPRLIDYLA